MFNLAATIIALTLMVALSLAGLYYLGYSTDEARLKSDLAQYYDYGAQIDAALLLYAFDHGRTPPGSGTDQVLALASGGYLSAPPMGGWFLKSQTATLANTSYRPLASTSECMALNRANGSDVTSSGIVSYGGCPPCDDPSYSSYVACIYSGSLPVAGSP